MLSVKLSAQQVKSLCTYGGHPASPAWTQPPAIRNEEFLMRETTPNWQDFREEQSSGLSNTSLRSRQSMPENSKPRPERLQRGPWGERGRNLKTKPEMKKYPTYHQLGEHGIQLLHWRHGQRGLHGLQGEAAVIAQPVRDLGVVTAAEAAEDEGDPPAAPLPRGHGHNPLRPSLLGTRSCREEKSGGSSSRPAALRCAPVPRWEEESSHPRARHGGEEQRRFSCQIFLLRFDVYSPGNLDDHAN